MHVLSDPQMSLTGTERVGVEQDFDERSEIEFEAGPGQRLAAMWHLMALTCARQLDTCVTWAMRCLSGVPFTTHDFLQLFTQQVQGRIKSWPVAAPVKSRLGPGRSRDN